MLSYYVTSRQYGLSPDYWDRYPDRITAVTQAQVHAAARSISTRRACKSSPWPPKITDLFKKYGTVVVYDTDGKRTWS